MNEFYEMHRSEAGKILLKKIKNPLYLTNLGMAEMLEDKFPEKHRFYIIKEDDIPLENNILTAETF